jgi:acetyltransferase-like isoleucine patch superfamily enzyme
MAWLDADGLEALGLASYGKDVRIDEDARIFGAERVHIGSHIRIDAYAFLSAGKEGIVLHNYCHIGVHCFLAGEERIEIGDFSGFSGRVSAYSSSDDFSGRAMTGPTFPDDVRRVDHRPVRLERYVAVGTGAIILPGVTVHDGVTIAALSLVDKDVPPFTIVGGVPAKKLGERKRDVIELGERLYEREPELRDSKDR